MAGLNQPITDYSKHLNHTDNQSPEAYTYIMFAREKLFSFIGIPSEILKAAKERTDTLVPIDIFVKSQRTMSKPRLDIAKIINTTPKMIGLAPESIRAKVDNLTELGLNFDMVTNTLPAALGFAQESILRKFKFIQKSAGLLHWKHSAIELIETHPAILSYNIEKLKVLRRIAADRIDTSERIVDPKVLKNALVTPLERHVIALSESENKHG